MSSLGKWSKGYGERLNLVRMIRTLSLEKKE